MAFEQSLKHGLKFDQKQYFLVRRKAKIWLLASFAHPLSWSHFASKFCTHFVETNHIQFQLFEGMKAYRGVDGKIRFFRPELNMARMNLTAKRSGLPSFDGDEFLKCMARLISIDEEWVPHHPEASLYIRPTMIGIEPTLGVASSDSALLYTILSPVGSYFKKGGSGAVSLLADPSVVRAWPGGVGDRKMGSVSFKKKFKV
jgi:branched-subunit amino acid aminotransferase/4-amino-4-deoxychorismate lyase